MPLGSCVPLAHAPAAKSSPLRTALMARHQPTCLQAQPICGCATDALKNLPFPKLHTHTHVHRRVHFQIISNPVHPSTTHAVLTDLSCLCAVSDQLPHRWGVAAGATQATTSLLAALLASARSAAPCPLSLGCCRAIPTLLCRPHRQPLGLLLLLQVSALRPVAVALGLPVQGLARPAATHSSSIRTSSCESRA